VKPSVKLGITFQPKDNGEFITTLSLQDLASAPEDIDKVLKWASETYRTFTQTMIASFKENKSTVRHGQKIPAVTFWDLGDAIFKLLENLSSRGLEFHNLYAHLKRDLKVSKSTIKRVIALRRYIPDKEMLPSDVDWGSCKDAPKKFASELLRKNE